MRYGTSVTRGAIVLAVMLAAWFAGPWLGLTPREAEALGGPFGLIQEPGAPALENQTAAAPPGDAGAPAGLKPDAVAQRIRAAIAEDQRRMAALEQDDLPKAVEELAAAQVELDRIKKERATLEARLAEVETSGDREQAAHLQTEMSDQETSLRLARERMDLARAEQKHTEAKPQAIRQKVAQAEARLAKLTAPVPPPPAKEEAPSPAEAPPQTPAPAPATEIPTLPGLPTIPGLPGAAAPSSPAPAAPAAPDPELTKARETAQTRAEALKSADESFDALTERIRLLDREIRAERDALATARKQMENAEATKADLQLEFQSKALNQAEPAVLDGIRGQIQESEKRFRAARLDSHQHGDHLVRLSAERSQLVAAADTTQFRARLAREQLDTAQKRLRNLENPFSLDNLVGWTLNHGLKILAILLGIWLLRSLSKIISRRIVATLDSEGNRGTTEEREHRIRTLVSVFDNLVSIVLAGGGTLMIFQELGVPVGPLLGGAAVFGLAVAFGAQNLIRDYFYGFVILLENQYKLNDVIKIRDISGQVELITLRMTVLRDQDGSVHFVPNGEITSVTNMTHGWSRALFEINIAHKEDVDHVIAVLTTLGKELRKDPMFAPMILEDLTMLGVEGLGESAVQIKFFIKTRPLQQWNVKREMLRRIKRRFDELGIVIPFPHRMIYTAGDRREEEALHDAGQVRPGLSLADPRSVPNN